MKKKQAPANTEEMASKNPIMRTWLLGGAPDMILAQEAQGQRSLVESDTVPEKMSAGEYDAKAILEAAGVRFLGAVEGDSLFQYAELPQGWKKTATNHSIAF